MHSVKYNAIWRLVLSFWPYHLFGYQFVVFLLDTLLLKRDFTASAKYKMTDFLWRLERRQLLPRRVVREMGLAGRAAAAFLSGMHPKHRWFPLPCLTTSCPFSKLMLFSWWWCLVCLLAHKAGRGNSFLNLWPLLIKTTRAETPPLCCLERVNGHGEQRRVIHKKRFLHLLTSIYMSLAVLRRIFGC